MAGMFRVDDMRELIRQFPPKASHETKSEHDRLVSTIRETHLISSAWMKKEFRNIYEDAKERISLETLPPEFDVNPPRCMEILKPEFDHCLFSSDRKSIISKQEQNMILDELTTISRRMGVSMKQFAHGNDISLNQMQELVKTINQTQTSSKSAHLEILEDGDSLVSRESHAKYLDDIRQAMRFAQDEAFERELVVKSHLQDVSLPNAIVLLLAKEVLIKDLSVNGWIQDRERDTAMFTPNSSILQGLQTGKLQYVNVSEPVRRPSGGKELRDKSKAVLREQILKDGVAYISSDGTAFSSSWMQDLSHQLDDDLRDLGIARISFTDLPNHVRSTVARMLTDPSNTIEEETSEALLQIPFVRLGNLLISEEWRHNLKTRLEDFARDSATKQVESAIVQPAFDVAEALENLVKSEKGLSYADRNDLKLGFLDRSLSSDVKSAFEGELARQYSWKRERFGFLYCDRILFRAELAQEFVKSINDHDDLAQILEETLKTWIQETLIPQNLRPQSPLSKLAQQCNDKALDRELEALKTQWHSVEDLRTFPSHYRITERANSPEARRKAKQGLIRKQQDHLAKETRPLDGLLELLIILLARRTPGFAHARGKHIPKLVNFLEGVCRDHPNGSETADFLPLLDQLKQKVKAGSAAEPDIELMRDIANRDAATIPSESA